MDGIITVLVVDDDESARIIARRALQKIGGIKTLEASDAESAIEIIDRGGVIDVVLSDLEMPGGMPGTELRDILRRRDFPGKVLVWTSSSEFQVMGADFAKPIGFAATQALLAAHIGRNN